MELEHPKHLKALKIDINLKKYICGATWYLRSESVNNYKDYNLIIRKSVCIQHPEFCKLVVEQLYKFFEMESTIPEYKYI